MWLKVIKAKLKQVLTPNPTPISDPTPTPNPVPTPGPTPNPTSIVPTPTPDLVTPPVKPIKNTTTSDNIEPNNLTKPISISLTHKRIAQFGTTERKATFKEFSQSTKRPFSSVTKANEYLPQTSSDNGTAAVFAGVGLVLTGTALAYVDRKKKRE